MSSLTAAERETVIVLNDADDTILITTCQKPWVTKLLKNPVFEQDKSPLALSDFEKYGVLRGLLPVGAISLRASGKGQSKRTGQRTINAVKCGHIKDDGTACQMVAKKDTGKCRWHSPKN